jgi:hypothetical protein
MKITLNETQINQIMELLNELPIKSTIIVQRISHIMNEGIEKEEKPTS